MSDESLCTKYNGKISFFDQICYYLLIILLCEAEAAELTNTVKLKVINKKKRTNLKNPPSKSFIYSTKIKVESDLFSKKFEPSINMFEKAVCSNDASSGDLV